MQSQTKAKSSLLLIELILVVLFFAITSAVCMGLFVRAHLVAQKSQDLNHAALLLSSTAEQLKIDLRTNTPYWNNLGDMQEDGSFITYYDDTWQELTSGESATYRRTVHITQENTLYKGALALVRLPNEDPLYALNISHCAAFGNREGGETNG